jgi:hypothetical protein
MTKKIKTPKQLLLGHLISYGDSKPFGVVIENNHSDRIIIVCWFDFYKNIYADSYKVTYNYKDMSNFLNDSDWMLNISGYVENWDVYLSLFFSIDDINKIYDKGLW